MLFDKSRVSAGAINFIDGHQKELYPFMISEGEREVDNKVFEYWSNFWWRVDTIVELSFAGLVSTPTRHLVLREEI